MCIRDRYSIGVAVIKSMYCNCIALSYGEHQFKSKRSLMLLACIGCSSSESNLTSCCSTVIQNKSHCHSGLYAGVRCMHMMSMVDCSMKYKCCTAGSQCIENSIQLVGELFQNKGYVVICLGGRWGKVCGGSTQAAVVVCRQLGFSAEGY